VLAASAALSACTVDRLGGPSGSLAEGRGVSGPARVAVDMAGRWTFGSPGGGSCVMNFRAAPGAAEGAIAPEGGCPGNFFTSRQWTFERDALIIKDHNGEPLARLAQAAPTHFEGQAVTGEPVTLTR
jgi:hypothetical protein